MIAQHRAWHIHHHRVAPVGFGHVEPEALDGIDDAVRWLRKKPERADVPCVLKRSSGRARECQQDDATLEHRTPAARRRHQQKEREAGREENRLEVIAERERVDSEKRGEPANRRTCGPSEQEEQRECRERSVQRVHLRDDRLTPERIRDGKQRRRGGRGGERARELHADEHHDSARECAFEGRREIEGPRRIAAHEGGDGVGDREVQRIAVARRNVDRSRHRLECAGVAEVEVRKECDPIQQECAGRDDHRGEPGRPCAAISAKRAWRQ